MASKRFLLGMLVLVLTFGMMAVGCEDDDKGETGETTYLSISDTGGANGRFYLTISSVDSVSWEDGITGTDVLSWLNISISDGNTTLGYGDYTDLQVDSVTRNQATVLEIVISYASQVNPGGAYPAACSAIVAIKEDASTFSAIKAKTNGVGKLELLSNGKSASKLLLKRS